MMALAEDEKITIEVSGQFIMEHSYKNFFRYRTIFEGMRQKFEVDDRKVSSGF